MLKVNKNVSLNGQSVIDDKVIVYMTATISTDNTQNISVNKNIVDQDAYYKNRVAVRQDISDFEDQVYLLEDSILGAE